MRRVRAAALHHPRRGAPVAADLHKTRLSAVTENNRYLVQFTSNHTDTILDDNDNDPNPAKR